MTPYPENLFEIGVTVSSKELLRDFSIHILYVILLQYLIKESVSGNHCHHRKKLVFLALLALSSLSGLPDSTYKLQAKAQSTFSRNFKTRDASS